MGKLSARWRRQLIAVAVFLVVAGGFALTFRLAVVDGDSMLPTYRDGRVVLVNRLYRLTGSLMRGDVVLVRKGDEVLIKRVAYQAGEVISGREVWEYWLATDRFDILSAGTWHEPPQLRVPPNSVVVLGDNAAVSDDSRLFGPIPLRDVLGKVVRAPAKR